jgi:hypothetical protein
MNKITAPGKFIFAAILTLLFSTLANAQKFAIITDKSCFDGANAEIRLYSETLAKEGLTNIIIIDKWGRPDSIRNQLLKLYLKKDGFEGAVFIGDIPVPMMRDAQHLTSAFKMDQERYAWYRSSVASDKYYEDFDLKFTYLKQDSAKKLLHYFSLNYNSPQKIQSEIYTGRIRIPWDKDHALLKAYLKKVVAAHQESNIVDQMLFFAGHGYNSESMTARLDEKVSLLQQFPQLNRQNNGLDYIDFSFDNHIKYRLLSTLSYKDIDIALLHHHGDTDAELVDAEPPANGVQDKIESIKYYLRSKVRDVKDPEASKKNYIKWLGVPESWFELADDKKQIEKDSIYSANMDIWASDVEKYYPKARFIMFDACFNGSYQVDDFISGRYVFGHSATVAAQGNTVNSLQDRLPDEMVGLLGLGMRVGEWNKMNGFIETHIIGDPTFRFTPSGGFKTYEMLASRGNSVKLLKLADNPHPDVQSWALRQLVDLKYPGVSKLLSDKYFASPFGSTRMECLKLLAWLGDQNFIKVLIASYDDSYELVRRMAAVYASESGDPDLIPAIVRVAANPNISKRENYQLTDALGFFEKNKMLAELENVYKGIDTTGNQFGIIINDLKKDIENQCKSTEKTLSAIISPETTKKNRIFEIKILRNKPYHTLIPALCKYVTECNDQQAQLTLLEAFGWFCYSYNKEEIIKTCSQIAASEKYPKQAREAASRTIIRLKNPS